MDVSDLLKANQDSLTDRDLALLADWAHRQHTQAKEPGWRKAYALIREGADLLLRRRAQNHDSGEKVCKS